ncbi:MAG: hypothetical protein ACTSUO_06085 [Candidatus Thorarchaeota archaeon]
MRMRFKDEVIQTWLNHLGTKDAPRFPREVSHAREIVNNVNEYLEYCQNNFETDELHTSLYSYPQLCDGVYDKIFHELDSTDIEKAYKDMRKLLGYYYTEGIEPRCYFSGSKGFHIIIDIKPTTIDLFASKLWILKVCNKLKVTTIDLQSVGDVRRCSRIPYSYNFKSLKSGKARMCIPIKLKWSLHRILRESLEPKEILTPDVNSWELEKRLISSKPYKLMPKRTVKLNEAYAREVIEKVLPIAHQIKDGRRRVLNFLIIPALSALKFKEDEIMKVCEAFLRTTGVSPIGYRTYLRGSIRRNVENMYPPLQFKDFFINNPDLIKYFRKGG